MKTDIEIAQEARMKPITQIAAQLGLEEESVIPYGRYKAKIDHRLIHNAKKQGKLILVTAISPTPAGEGKTTTSVGLADAMNALGKKTMLCLREPSLGPVFGVKGGAAGGGYAQVVPMEDINLHFTGDLHAIGTANNLLAAMIDNSIQQGNPLNIDPRRITWKRCMDMNDRQLRFIVDGLGGKVNGTPREDGFDITVASEVMAIFCLATSISDLKERLSRIVCAYTYDGKPVTAGEIGAAGAMTALLKDALDPNLVQTLENNPAIIHGGPFANIAHGCNSVLATKLSLSLADYTITEAGFGADLGAEKFLDIKCRYAGIAPSACRAGGYRARPQEPRRRSQGRPEPAQPRGRQGRCFQPDPPHRQPEERLRSAGGGGHQRLPHRHRRGAGLCGAGLRRAGRALRAERGVRQGRRGRQGTG